GERIDYSQDRQWTSYITPDPIKLIQNIFGGGDVQRDRIAIADLEIKAADLEAAKAELDFARGNIQSSLEQEVLELLLTYEESTRQRKLTQSQLDTFNQQYEIYRIKYRFGQGSTSELLSLEQRGNQLNTDLTNQTIEQQESIRKLVNLTGYSVTSDQ
ncbi:MAG: TolC family protein, partial [Okeania sp. SIO2D1]|nr:TolC family protein [Okeania sp. SIO2D1]